MPESQGEPSTIRRAYRRYKKLPRYLRLAIIIAIGVTAFIIIITSAWKQELLKVTSGV